MCVHSPPTCHHLATHKPLSTIALPMSSAGGHPLCFCPFINQPSVLHKNMEELLLPQYTPIYNGSSAEQQEEKKVNGSKKELKDRPWSYTSNGKKNGIAKNQSKPSPRKEKLWYHLSKTDIKMWSVPSPGTDAKSGPWLVVVDPDSYVLDVYNLLWSSNSPLWAFN